MTLADFESYALGLNCEALMERAKELKKLGDPRLAEIAVELEELSMAQGWLESFEIWRRQGNERNATAVAQQYKAKVRREAGLQD